MIEQIDHDVPTCERKHSAGLVASVMGMGPAYMYDMTMTAKHVLLV